MTTTQQVKRGRDLETDRAHDAFWETLDGLNDDVTDLRDKLAQEQQANAALLGWFKEFRALVCKAAWALAMPGADAVNFTGFEQQRKGDLQNRHYHQLLSGDASDAFADLAALDTSGYAPAPVDAGNLIDGTGTGEPPVPPRYDPRTASERDPVDMFPSQRPP